MFSWTDWQPDPIALMLADCRRMTEESTTMIATIAPFKPKRPTKKMEAEAAILVARVGALDVAAIDWHAKHYDSGAALQALIALASQPTTLNYRTFAGLVAGVAARCVDDGGAFGFVPCLADPALSVWQDVIATYHPESEAHRLYRDSRIARLFAVRFGATPDLYVVPCGDRQTGTVEGYTCLGFAVCERRIAGYCAYLGAEVPAGVRGTLARYAEYEALEARVLAEVRRTGRRCEAELTPQLIGLEGKRVSVVTSWGEADTFKVGRSTGPIPIHLAIHRANEAYHDPVTGAPFQSLTVIG